MVPVWFTWFFIIGTALCSLLIINEDKLLKAEEKFEERKKERGVCGNELHHKER